MSSIVTLQNGSLLTGIPSSPAASKAAEIVYREFGSTRPLPLADTIGLESLMREFESDRTMAGHLADARKNLVHELYADEQETLSALRLAAGMSQAQLAHKAETTQPYIARIERGQADPSTEMVARLASALNVSEEQTFRAIRNQRSIHG